MSKRNTVVFAMSLAITFMMMVGKPVYGIAKPRSAFAQAMKSQAPQQTLDDLFAAVARQVPEFGGMFLGDNEETLQVYLSVVSPTKVVAVQKAIVAVFGTSVIPKGGVKALQGQYGFLQLKDWYDRMTGPILRVSGVTFTDIAEGRNHLAIGIGKPEVESRVIEQLQKLAIPRESVVIELSGPIETLTHTVRMPNSMSPWPYLRAGGYILTRLLCNQTGVGISQATLGFNIIGPSLGAGFVTASHATAAWWRLDTIAGFPPADFYQASGYYPPHLVGRETVDPHGFTGGACPTGLICRYSDSAFVRYNSNVKFGVGHIARTTGITTSVTSPILTIDHGGSPSGEFLIVAAPSVPYLTGLTLNKVGHYTGWTQGKIQMTNANFSQIPSAYIQVGCPGGLADPTMPPAGATLLSQYVVGDPTNDVVHSGDSGSPVFRSLKGLALRRAELYGIVWAGFAGTYKQFIFSPIGGVPFQPTGVKTDLPPFRYCDASASPPC